MSVEQQRPAKVGKYLRVSGDQRQPPQKVCTCFLVPAFSVSNNTQRIPGRPATRIQIGCPGEVITCNQHLVSTQRQRAQGLQCHGIVRILLQHLQSNRFHAAGVISRGVHAQHQRQRVCVPAVQRVGAAQVQQCVVGITQIQSLLRRRIKFRGRVDGCCRNRRGRTGGQQHEQAEITHCQGLLHRKPRFSRAYRGRYSQCPVKRARLHPARVDQILQNADPAAAGY